MDIGTIEDLLIAKITEKLPYLAKVAGYQGELQKDLSEIVFRPMTVLVSLVNSRDVGGSFSSYGLDHTFDLIVMCRNLRGETEGRRDDDRGAYRVLDDLRQYLNGVQLSADLQPLKFVKEEALIISRELVAYTATYSAQQEIEYG